MNDKILTIVCPTILLTTVLLLLIETYGENYDTGYCTGHKERSQFEYHFGLGQDLDKISEIDPATESVMQSMLGDFTGIQTPYSNNDVIPRVPLMGSVTHPGGGGLQVWPTQTNKQPDCSPNEIPEPNIFHLFVLGLTIILIGGKNAPNRAIPD